MSLQLVFGPRTASLSKDEAERALTTNPAFPKGSSFVMEEHEGQWVAAIHVAEFPPSSDDGPPTDSGPEAPPESDAPEAPAEDSPPKDDGGDEKPKGDDKGEKGGEKAELHHLIDMMTKIVDALGLGDPVDSPLPGDDLAGPPGGPEGGPPPGPPGADPMGPDGKQHIVHDRALKPGEAPPGTTPIGAPAFASVRDDHPWKGIAGKAASFMVDDSIGDAKTSAIQSELSSLAKEIGYELKQFIPYIDKKTGQRFAKAEISAYSSK